MAINSHAHKLILTRFSSQCSRTLTRKTEVTHSTSRSKPYPSLVQSLLVWISVRILPSLLSVFSYRHKSVSVAYFLKVRFNRFLIYLSVFIFPDNRKLWIILCATNSVTTFGESKTMRRICVFLFFFSWEEGKLFYFFTTRLPKREGGLDS